MEPIISIRIQIITIIVSFLFLFYIGRLIVKRKLREEYSIIWVIATIILIIFSFWRDGLEIIAKLLGVNEAPNLIFTGAIFLMLIYLLHLSVVASELHEKNKKLSQDIALMKEKLNKNIESREQRETS